jgi:two-component system LytT family response regulator
MNHSCIIIDDMSLARASLIALIQEHIPDMDIIGQADSVVSGSKLLRRLQPEIVFLDIDLGDGEGFDILEILPNNHAKVIFITASDEHAIKAFRFAAIDYLLKPIDADELLTAVNRAYASPTQAIEQYQSLHSAINKKDTPLTRLALHTAEEIRMVNISDIVRMEANGNYTQFFFKNGSKLLVTKTLKEFDKTLAEDGFVRTHQSHLINLNYIKAYIKTEGGYIEMTDRSIIPVAVRKKAEVVHILSNS